MFHYVFRKMYEKHFKILRLMSWGDIVWNLKFLVRTKDFTMRLKSTSYFRLVLFGSRYHFLLWSLAFRDGSKACFCTSFFIMASLGWMGFSSSEFGNRSYENASKKLQLMSIFIWFWKQINSRLPKGVVNIPLKDFPRQLKRLILPPNDCSLLWDHPFWSFNAKQKPLLG